MKAILRLIMSVAVAIFSAVALRAQVKLYDLSARGNVGGGDNTFTAGVVVNQESDVLFRVAGPGLAAQAPALQYFVCKDPRLAVFNSKSQQIAANDNWDDTPTNAASVLAADKKVGAFDLVGGDAAIVLHLQPGAYTVQSLSDDKSEGLAIMEIFPMVPGSVTIKNLSARGQVKPGNASLIVGIAVAGNGKANLLFRAVGPTLENFGVHNVLPDPFLTVYRIDGSVTYEITHNDNSDMAQFVFDDVYTFRLPAGTKDAALGLNLEFRNNIVELYTAVVKAAPGTPDTGVVLVELYFTDNTPQ